MENLLVKIIFLFRQKIRTISQKQVYFTFLEMVFCSAGRRLAPTEYLVRYSKHVLTNWREFSPESSTCLCHRPSSHPASKPPPSSPSPNSQQRTAPTTTGLLHLRLWSWSASRVWSRSTSGTVCLPLWTPINLPTGQIDPTGILSPAERVDRQR